MIPRTSGCSAQEAEKNEARVSRRTEDGSFHVFSFLPRRLQTPGAAREAPSSIAARLTPSRGTTRIVSSPATVPSTASTRQAVQRRGDARRVPRVGLDQPEAPAELEGQEPAGEILHQGARGHRPRPFRRAGPRWSRRRAGAPSQCPRKVRSRDRVACVAAKPSRRRSPISFSWLSAAVRAMMSRMAARRRARSPTTLPPRPPATGDPPRLDRYPIRLHRYTVLRQGSQVARAARDPCSVPPCACPAGEW